MTNGRRAIAKLRRETKEKLVRAGHLCESPPCEPHTPQPGEAQHALGQPSREARCASSGRTALALMARPLPRHNRRARGLPESATRMQVVSPHRLNVRVTGLRPFRSDGMMEPTLTHKLGDLSMPGSASRS
jgi:hypothetical protein